MVALTAAPAAAAPPTNDTFAGSVVIGAVPFSATVDTTEATTDAIDTQANAGCGAPATDASVWSRTGSATVTGTFTCSGQVQFSAIQVELMQQVGRGVVYGFGVAEVPCDGTAAPFAVEVAPLLGTKFAGGKAASVTLGFACGVVFCGFDFVERTVQLSRR